MSKASDLFFIYLQKRLAISNLGLLRIWFNLAMVLFVLYLLYNLCFFLITNVQEDYRYTFYALKEFLAIGGLPIAYPTMCHYADKGMISKRSSGPATTNRALSFTNPYFWYGTWHSVLP